MSDEANPSYKVKLISTVMLVRKVKLSPSVFLAHAKALESGLAKYPIRRVVCKTYTIPAGNLDGNHEKLFNGQLPSRLVIGCVDNDAFNGNNVKNPFNFKHFSLSEISLHLEFQSSVVGSHLEYHNAVDVALLFNHQDRSAPKLYSLVIFL